MTQYYQITEVDTELRNAKLKIMTIKVIVALKDKALTTNF